MTFEQQIMELQELYNAQQLLTAELSEKLEWTEVIFYFIIEIILVSGQQTQNFRLIPLYVSEKTRAN